MELALMSILPGVANRQPRRAVHWGFPHFLLEYQPSGAGGTRSPPATPPRLLKPNRPLNPKWLIGFGKRLNLRLFDPPINFR